MIGGAIARPHPEPGPERAALPLPRGPGGRPALARRLVRASVIETRPSWNRM